MDSIWDKKWIADRKAMKKTLILFVLCLHFYASAQKGIIDTLYVTDLIERCPISVIEENFGEGPFIYGECNIFNNQTDTLLCYSMIYFTFKFDTTTIKSLPAYMHMGMEFIPVPPKQTYTFTYGVPLLFNQFHNEITSGNGDERVWNHTDLFREIQSSLMLHVSTNYGVIDVVPSIIARKEKDR